MAETHLLGLPRKHKPKDIKPQGAGSGLDADKVDGLHASEIGGGGLHASNHETGGSDKVHFADLERDETDATLHDAFTVAPHISQADKDRIHDRQHVLNSALDHSGSLGAGHHGSLADGDHTGSLSGNARVKVRKNSGADVGSRRRLNFVEGSNVTLTVADDSANEEIDIVIASASGGGTPESVIMGCMFAFFSGFDVYSTAGSVTKCSWGGKITTPLTSPYKGYFFYDYVTGITPIALFDKSPQFELYLQIQSDAYDTYVIIGGLAGDAITASAKKFGIHILANSLKIVSADGTTQSESASLMTLSLNTWYKIRCKLTSGTNIEVWVDGVSKGTKNTNLPSGNLTINHACPQILGLGSVDGSFTIIFAGLKVMHNY